MCPSALLWSCCLSSTKPRAMPSHGPSACTQWVVRAQCLHTVSGQGSVSAHSGWSALLEGGIQEPTWHPHGPRPHIQRPRPSFPGSRKDSSCPFHLNRVGFHRPLSTKGGISARSSSPSSGPSLGDVFTALPTCPHFISLGRACSCLLGHTQDGALSCKQGQVPLPQVAPRPTV